MWIFTPIYKRPIWGGTRLAAFKGDAEATGNIGESWEVSAVPGNVSVVAEGPDEGLTLDALIAQGAFELLGHHVANRYGLRFPLLIKFIDAQDDLSVQVHPDDEMARAIGHSFGKNEMWVVLDAVPGARLANGFRYPVNPDDLDRLVKTGEITDVLRYSSVHPGSAFYVPAGRVHAIGAGILTVEIQQTSDDTFRLYDYNRTDAQGHRRQLHIPQARRAVNYTDVDGRPLTYTTSPDSVSTICDTPYFDVNMLRADARMRRDYSGLDSFVIIMVVNGKAELEAPSGTIILKRGHTALLPATDLYLDINPQGVEEFRALEIYISQ